jgi:hypothetical protein
VRRQKSGNERGAALVEAAIVLPLILVILIGTVEFGLSLADLISVRQGTRDATRNAVVNNYGSDTVCGIVGTVTNDETKKIICGTKNEIDRPEARVRVKVAFPDGGKTPPPDDNSLLVCAEFRHRSPTGMFGFLLNNRISTTRVSMRVEQDLSAVDAGEETSLSGSWAWCS